MLQTAQSGKHPSLHRPLEFLRENCSFATAFAGVPAAKTRTFTDADIAGLAQIDVANGKC